MEADQRYVSPLTADVSSYRAGNIELVDFRVEIYKADAADLGVDVLLSDVGDLIVVDVREGPILEWNAANPRWAVRQGDVILDVNGHNSETQAIVEALMVTGTLTVTFGRPVPVATSAPAGRTRGAVKKAAAARPRLRPPETAPAPTKAAVAAGAGAAAGAASPDEGSRGVGEEVDQIDRLLRQTAIQPKRKFRSAAPVWKPSGSAATQPVQWFPRSPSDLQQLGGSDLAAAEQDVEEEPEVPRSEWRMQAYARARAETVKIKGLREAQHAAAKKSLQLDRKLRLESTVRANIVRGSRWASKLQGSPFAVDLFGESMRSEEVMRSSEEAERRRAKVEEKQKQPSTGSLLSKAMAPDSRSSMEKRQALERDRRLRALRDVERSNSRTTQIMREEEEKAGTSRRRAQATSRLEAATGDEDLYVKVVSTA
eukprot:TRINITY_DN15772_c0_g1_i2.p1 TRINITY_DN15772_c0_g1~~TRINITY_DN15772_c0_g1_i2.p1  ORF type:complete len:427 (-),score=108.39 TRINITY_DN15772_c0_g1_i2:421-1701(-)